MVKVPGSTMTAVLLGMLSALGDGSEPAACALGVEDA